MTHMTCEFVATDPCDTRELPNSMLHNPVLDRSDGPTAAILSSSQQIPQPAPHHSTGPPPTLLDALLHKLGVLALPPGQFKAVCHAQTHAMLLPEQHAPAGRGRGLPAIQPSSGDLIAHVQEDQL